MSLRKVTAGDPLVVPASTFNAFIDAAVDFQRRQRNATAQPQHTADNRDVILVRNDSGADRGRFDVLGIDGPLIAREDNQNEFKNNTALIGSTPSASHAGKFVILLEPVPAGEIAPACIAGVCVARVNMLDESHAFADVQAGVASELNSTDSGVAQLLWVEPPASRVNPPIAWAVIRFGGGGGSAAVFQIVYVSADSGSGTPGDYHTYTIYSDAAMTDQLATGLAPYEAKIDQVDYTAAPAGSMGVASNIGGTWTLWKVWKETPVVSTCDCV